MKLIVLGFLSLVLVAEAIDIKESLKSGKDITILQLHHDGRFHLELLRSESLFIVKTGNVETHFKPHKFSVKRRLYVAPSLEFGRELEEVIIVFGLTQRHKELVLPEIGLQKEFFVVLEDLAVTTDGELLFVREISKEELEQHQNLINERALLDREMLMKKGAKGDLL